MAFASSGFDAEKYFASRPRYNAEIFNLIYAYHEKVHQGSEGGRFDAAVDLGCGPGQSAYPQMTRFRHVAGVDPSQKMLTQARSIPAPWNVFNEGRQAPESHTITFQQGTSEQTGLEDQSVDLVTAATAAHLFDWFSEPDGERVWQEMARITRPRASVCFFSYYCPHVRDTDMAHMSKLMARVYLDNDKLGPYYKDEEDDSHGKRKWASIVREYYDPIPHPRGPQWIEEATMHLKLEWNPALEYSSTKSTALLSKDAPRWVKDVLGEEAKSPLTMKKPLHFWLGLVRTTSGYTRYLEAHPDEVPLVEQGKDACQKWAEAARLAQARFTAAKELGKDEVEISEEEASRFLVDWHTEVEFYFPLAVLCCKRSSLQ